MKLKGKAPAGGAARRPPAPSEDHGEIEGWMGRVMPDLQPIIRRLDEVIRETVPGLRYGLKWRKAYYGLPELGWIIELAAYDVSANVVFLAGAEFGEPPPLGEGRSRYVKVRTLAEAEAPALREWVREAARYPGWRWEAA